MSYDASQGAQPQKVAIVGGGAVGRVFASVLSLAGHDVTLFAREQTVHSLNESRGAEGFLFTGSETQGATSVDFKLRPIETARNHSQGFDTVLYAVKAPFVAKAVEQTADLLNPDTIVMFAQGGIQWWAGYKDNTVPPSVTDPHNAIEQHVNLDRVVPVLVSFGASVDPDNPAHIRQSGTHMLAVGQAFGQAQSVLDQATHLISNDHLSVNIQDNVFEKLWNKASGSFAMSAFALITGKTLGEMTSDPEILSQMVAAAETLKQAGTEMGLKCSMDYEDYFRLLGQSLPNHYMSITKDTSEIAYILDLPVQIANSLGINTQRLEDIMRQAHEAVDKLNKDDPSHGQGHSPDDQRPRPQ